MYDRDPDGIVRKNVNEKRVRKGWLIDNLELVRGNAGAWVG
jgi:hypothetical protein